MERLSRSLGTACLLADSVTACGSSGSSGCSIVPKSGKGSFSGMAQDPVATSDATVHIVDTVLMGK